ncbi:hypothetical protein ACFQ7F_25285 [Streptomyces sp. NPDC056486]|uniref:hypothetical protein n=1 Tax=Streptomyces sp. NPDC056486 TaxID=3345835 RepID=UPI00368BC117
MPKTIPLRLDYDIRRLRADIELLTSGPRPVLSAASGRRVVPLWRQTTVEVAAPGVPGKCGSGQETEWLRGLPYVAEALASIPAPLRGARLLAQASQTSLRPHRIAKCGPRWGLCRLRLPIITGPRAEVVFADGEPQHLTAGVLWFGSFWEPHITTNNEPYEQIHLVIDVLHTPELAQLFPPDARRQVWEPLGLFLRPVRPLPPDGAFPYGCRFRIPESFTNREALGEILHDPFPDSADARIHLGPDGPLLTIGPGIEHALDHLGDGEFRLRGWSDERTLQIVRADRVQPHVLLRVRNGPHEHALRVEVGEWPR